MNKLLILLQIILFVLISSSCRQAYKCFDENGKPTAEIEVYFPGNFLNRDGIQQICDIVRESINY